MSALRVRTALAELMARSSLSNETWDAEEELFAQRTLLRSTQYDLSDIWTWRTLTTGRVPRNGIKTKSFASGSSWLVRVTLPKP